MGVDIRVRVSDGGRVSQIYAIRQAISKALVAYYQKWKIYIKSLNVAYKKETYISLTTRASVVAT